MPHKYAFVIEYNGRHYHGWQKQSNCCSVQAAVEAAIAQFANHPVTSYCAGRTDAGVHATSQVIHIESHVERSLQQWHSGVNSYLPKNIRIRKVVEALPHFHARFSACYRRYLYVIYCAPNLSAFIADYVYWLRKPLNIGLMQQAALQLVGRFNFNAFRSSHCQATNTQRHIIALNIYTKNELIIIDITANAFLHHMVRIIAGHLIKIGWQEKTVEWLVNLRNTAIRDISTAMLPSHGLHLIDVHYPIEFNLENICQKPWFL